MTDHAERMWRFGLVANVVTAVAVAAAYALSQPLYGTADESAHADHAYRLWHGELVRIGDPMQMPQVWGFLPPFNWTGQHPPLFYLLQAPIVGPLTDADRLLVAGLAGRGVNVILTGAVVVAVMWTVRQVLPGRPQASVAAGLAVAVTPGATSLGGLLLNDIPFLLWVTLLVGVTVRMMRQGISTGPAVAFGLCAAAALATRLPGAVVIAVCATVLGLRWLVALHGRAWPGIVRLAAGTLVAVGVNAWFYLRNLQTNGSISGAQTELVGQPGPLQHRTVRPVYEVAADPVVWRQLLTPLVFEDRWALGLLVTAVPVAVGVIVVLRRTAPRTDPVSVWIAVLLGGLTLAIVVLQLDYAAHGGGISWRYLVPLTIVPALLAGIGLSAVPRLAWAATAVWGAAVLVLVTLYVAPPNPGAGEAMAPTYPGAALVALAVAVIGLTGTVVALRRLGAGAVILRACRRSRDPART